MNINQMKAMPLHEIRIEPPNNNGMYKTYIQRVPNGWNYIYPTGPVFVPEVLSIIQPIVVGHGGNNE
jgi:hypothetical protein